MYLTDSPVLCTSRLLKYIASPKLLAQLVVEIPSNQLCEVLVFVNFPFVDILKNFTLEQRLNLIEKTKCKHPEAYMLQGCLDLTTSDFEIIAVGKTVKNKYDKHLLHIPGLIFSHQQRNALLSL